MRVAIIIVCALGMWLTATACRRRPPTTAPTTTPTTQQPADLESMDDPDVIVTLVQRIWPRYNEDGLEGLNEAERVVLCVFTFDAEVNNGGFEQFYFNNGDLAVATPGALAAIGETQMQQLVRDGNALFGESGPATDIEAVRKQFDELPESAIRTMQSFGPAFLDAEQNMMDLLAKYAREHHTEIREP